MTARQTRGERNNNPGNIRKDPTVWKGEVPSADASFEAFDNAEDGIRALAKILIVYQRKHGLKTVRQIINRWAPPVENNTSAYVDAVCAEMGVSPDVEILLDSPSILFIIVKAIIRHENGRVLYADTVIEDGIDAALA